MGSFRTMSVHGNELDVRWDENAPSERIKVTEKGTAYAYVSERCCFVVTLVRDGLIVDQWDTQADDWWNPPAGHVTWEDRMDPDRLAKFLDHWILHELDEEKRREDAIDMVLQGRYAEYTGDE